MTFYKKCTTKSYSFLVNDVTFASDSPLHFKNKKEYKN